MSLFERSVLGLPLLFPLAIISAVRLAIRLMDPFVVRLWWGIRAALVLINNLYCIPTYVVWMLLLHPLSWVSPQLYWMIEGKFFHWLLTMVAFWSHSAQYRIVESGDELDNLIGEETLVMVNHQSTSDVPLIMAAFAARPNILPNLNWIMDAVFKYTNFGVVSALHGDFFINAGREKREASIQDLIVFLKNRFVPRDMKWLVLFPEGGFLRKRKDNSNKYCRKLGLDELDFVTLPRLGALGAVMDTIGPQPSTSEHNHFENGDCHAPVKRRELKWVVDMTIAYPDGKPLDLVAIITGCVPPCKVHFHYRVYPIQQVPLNRKLLQEWLYTRYFEKEVMLAKYYRRGKWTEGGEGRLLEQDILRILVLHLFFLMSSLLHLVMLGKIIHFFV